MKCTPPNNRLTALRHEIRPKALLKTGDQLERGRDEFWEKLFLNLRGLGERAYDPGQIVIDGIHFMDECSRLHSMVRLRQSTVAVRGAGQAGRQWSLREGFDVFLAFFLRCIVT